MINRFNKNKDDNKQFITHKVLNIPDEVEIIKLNTDVESLNPILDNLDFNDKYNKRRKRKDSNIYINLINNNYNFKVSLLHISIIFISFLSLFVFSKERDNNIFNLRKSIRDYKDIIEEICPGELQNNPAKKKDFYLSVTDYHIQKSLINKFFSHCGAWCLYDYKDPRKGWYWNYHTKVWETQENMIKICPLNESYYALEKYVAIHNLLH